MQFVSEGPVSVNWTTPLVPTSLLISIDGGGPGAGMLELNRMLPRFHRVTLPSSYCAKSTAKAVGCPDWSYSACNTLNQPVSVLLPRPVALKSIPGPDPINGQRGAPG